ncbi:alkaline phosphatase D family protein [Nocardia cyriacigeorgica]|uniref:alkaline phosphatase D family protein n=1 Tax=Nocardia cyriacigeorgica TaxID=135487 RepID=UPI0018936436|nr:alkaline phosphatase D family protein [Nocardia cyriacigeorgica]MBF6095406.1 alkaline phosphatase D family protein [Nocardia cyriacigeorgica]MBF6396587.1 alkaline phosphatase D family protein [Nocardia cyriacigeorgica]MBF6402219.1 alkaline phosphatase D family protein [Nocardia cyriacigeorgica]
MGLSRRQLFRFGGVASAAALAGSCAVSGTRFRAPRWTGDPFTLGVASGEPTSDGVVLWTRLAPDPFAPDGHGGMPAHPVTVDFEIAEDEHFRQVVRRGSVVADRALGHSVHPEIGGLEPQRWYYYRFRAGSALSPVGRTRTAPRPGTGSRVRFAYASCQAWNDGHYTAYRHLADEDLDLVVHLGDYIYEYPLTGRRRGVRVPSPLRHEARDLTGYRLHYAWFKSEEPLRRAHAAFPWLVTMDDHEVDDDWAADAAASAIDLDALRAVFLRRRAAAFQAMYEHQPLRLAQLPSGPNMRLHRRYRFGDLAEITLLDTRQYRTRQACGGEIVSDCAQAAGVDRTILGGAQRQWLLDGFAHSPARWQILGNQVVLGRTDHDPGPGVAISTDAWDGYASERAAILGAAADRSVRNLVVLTGDRHENYAADLRRDVGDSESAVVAAEFTGTSISSGGDGVDLPARGRDLLAANPDLKFYNSQRGYVRVEVDERVWRTDFRVVPYVERPGAPVHTRASFVVQDGVPGAVEASRWERPATAEPTIRVEHAAAAPIDPGDNR